MCRRLQPYVSEAATLRLLQVDGFGGPPTRDSRWPFYLPKVALVPQHGQSARSSKRSPWQYPAQLVCLLRARLAAPGGSRHPGREAGPLGAQPLP